MMQSFKYYLAVTLHLFDAESDINLQGERERKVGMMCNTAPQPRGVITTHVRLSLRNTPL